MDRDSDNFRAEMLLKELGAERATAARRPPAPRSCATILARGHVPLAGVVIADGSGLSLPTA